MNLSTLQRTKKLTAFLYTEDDLFGLVCLCIPPSVLRGREEQQRRTILELQSILCPLDLDK